MSCIYRDPVPGPVLSLCGYCEFPNGELNDKLHGGVWSRVRSVRDYTPQSVIIPVQPSDSHSARCVTNDVRVLTVLRYVGFSDITNGQTLFRPCSQINHVLEGSVNACSAAQLQRLST
jgi:hypothetical protein